MAGAGAGRAQLRSGPFGRSWRAAAECRLAVAPIRGRNGERTLPPSEGAAGGDDRVLMLLFQDRGDLRAFEELFRRHRLPLYRYLRGLMHSPEIAEETSQHAWLKVIEAARSGRYNASSQSSFKTWLYTLARNHYIDHYVRAHGHTRTASNSEELLSNASDDLEALDCQLNRQRLAGTLQRAVAALPIEQREVVLLWSQGHELTAIAAIAGVPWETIVSRKKYAIAKLRVALATVGVTPDDV
jgi:RNA polymerase sigma factor (sigma-70 family)